MEQLLLFGAILVVIALLGGGLSAAGVDVPVVRSRTVRTLLFLIGAGLIGVGSYRLVVPPNVAPEPPPQQAAPIEPASSPMTGGVSATTSGDNAPAAAVGDNRDGIVSQGDGNTNSVKETDCKTTGSDSHNICGSEISGNVNIQGDGK